MPEDALDLAIADIRKSYGVGSIMLLGDDTTMDVEALPTGIPVLDRALGVGGLPLGRMVELFGPEMSGKSTIALHLVAQAQSQGMRCAYIDTEYALDPVYARNLGVDPDALYVSQPDNGEQALEILERLASSGAISVIVVDSVAALTPRAEIEGEMGDAHVGLHARMMSQGLRKLTGVCSRNNVLVLWINQIREKIGVIYGSPEVTTGGRALKFYSSVRMDVRRKEAIKVDGDVVANRTRVKIVKNKVAPPFKECEFDIEFGRGAAIEGILLDLGVELGVIKKAGAWYTYEGEQLGQGRDKAKTRLREDIPLAKEIQAALK